MNKLYRIKCIALIVFLGFEIKLEASTRGHGSLLPLLTAPQKRERDESSRESSVSVAATAEYNYERFVDQQRNFLLQQFCRLVGVTQNKFFEEYDAQRDISEKYILRQDTGEVQSSIMQNAIRRIRRFSGNRVVSVRQVEQLDDFDICRSVGVIGTDVCLYPPFFVKNAEQREEDLLNAAMQVDGYDAHCVSTMHSVLWQQRTLPKERCVQAQEFIALYSALVGPWLKMRAWLERMPSSAESTGDASLSGNQSDMSQATQQSAISAASSGSVVFCGQNDREKYLRGKQNQA